MLSPAHDDGCNDKTCHVVGMAGKIFISTIDFNLISTVTDAGTGLMVYKTKVRLSENDRVEYRAITDPECRFAIKRVKVGEYTMEVIQNQ